VADVASKKYLMRRYEDAERDCTSALRIAEGHVKALYRRAMARKGLERYAEALQGATPATVVMFLE
jgi:hypothetical protein